MIDPGSVTAIILSALAMIGAGWSQVKHCKSGCCEIDKNAIDKKESELVINNGKTNKNRE